MASGGRGLRRSTNCEAGTGQHASVAASASIRAGMKVLPQMLRLEVPVEARLS